MSGEAARALLELHLQGMRAHSPPGQVFALNLSGLLAPDVTVWSAWSASAIAGIGALKDHGEGLGEVKSMRTHPDFLRRGVGAALLEHIIAEAHARRMRQLSLETGSGLAFEPALALYRERGFVDGGCSRTTRAVRSIGSCTFPWSRLPLVPARGSATQKHAMNGPLEGRGRHRNPREIARRAGAGLDGSPPRMRMRFSFHSQFSRSIRTRPGTLTVAMPQRSPGSGRSRTRRPASASHRGCSRPSRGDASRCAPCQSARPAGAPRACRRVPGRWSSRSAESAPRAASARPSPRWRACSTAGR